MSNQLTASTIGPCPTIIDIVGRPGTGSLPRTIAPPDHPQVNIEYFVESIRRKPVSTKWTFHKMTLRQKAFSTKWLSRRSVVRRSVVYPDRYSLQLKENLAK